MDLTSFKALCMRINELSQLWVDTGVAEVLSSMVRLLFDAVTWKCWPLVLNNMCSVNDSVQSYFSF